MRFASDAASEGPATRLWYETVPLVDRAALIAALEAEDLLVSEWMDDAGASYDPHVHEHEEVRVVLEGSMVVIVDGREHRLAAGDRIDLAPGQPHSARVGEDGVRYLAGSLRTGFGGRSVPDVR